MTDKEAMKLALEALEQTLQTLDDENAKPGGAIADTIWHSEHETLFDYLKSEITAIKEVLAEHAMRETQRLGQEIEQEPVAMLERTPRLGILRVTYEDAVTELDEGLYPLYVKPQIEVGCAECGVNGGHALYCVACAEKFLINKAIEHEREECASLNIPITTPKRDYLDMSPLEIYEEALMDATLSFRAAIRARGQA
jgi:hypothetical protein